MRSWMVCLLVLSFGCHDKKDAPPSRAAPTMDPDGREVPDCQAVVTWLQKDAYKEVAGPTTPGWPPHTTTQVTIECESGDGSKIRVGAGFMENHGTKPDELDADRKRLLSVARTTTVGGDRAKLMDLLQAFRKCECAPSADGGPGTRFLSLESKDDVQVKKVLAAAAGYVKKHLRCTAKGGVDELLALLERGQIQQLHAKLGTCRWPARHDWSTCFDYAVKSSLVAADQTLQGYHVCNNDSQLQANLFEAFARTGTATSCDKASDLCKGPQWFYRP